MNEMEGIRIANRRLLREGLRVGAAVLLLAGNPAFGADEDEPETVQFYRSDWEANIPGRLQALFDKGGIKKTRRISVTANNPFYLAADFDGDGKGDFICYLETIPGSAPDVGVGVKSETAEEAERSVMVVFFGDGKVRFPEKEANFPGGSWSLADKGQKIPVSPYEKKPPPKPKGDALWMIKPESSVALLYWDGKKFASYFVSD